MTPQPKTDGELLREFVANGAEGSFEEPACRHARMVLSVCRRASGRGRDCEDMMQNVFVTLARKATSLTELVSLAG